MKWDAHQGFLAMRYRILRYRRRPATLCVRMPVWRVTINGHRTEDVTAGDAETARDIVRRVHVAYYDDPIERIEAEALTLPDRECAHCRGSGRVRYDYDCDPPPRWATCQACGGEGRVLDVPAMTECYPCRGSGRAPQPVGQPREDLCAACGGTGRVTEVPG